MGEGVMLKDEISSSLRCFRKIGLDFGRAIRKDNFVGDFEGLSVEDLMEIFDF